ncbi:MAG: UDP-N-acetylmuramoyl-L-alanine--D-glutamate ligase, partial [Clostridia bacterium]
ELSHGFCVRGGMICNGATPILDVHDIKIPGAHNVENYLAAIAALDGMVPNDVIVYVARTFGGVAHRMEHVRSFRGAEYYNDSIASSPTRTIAGLRSFQCPVILIAGGYDKNIPFDVLGPEIIAHVKALVLVGATASKIRDCVVNAAGYNPDVLPIIECETFKSAVNTAASLARAGDVVTLSPACASFDLFKNFAERGDAFRRLVNELCEE